MILEFVELDFFLLILCFCRNRADAVLERAQDVVKALDEAEQAQVAAREAIKKANEDIEMARSDLEHVIDYSGCKLNCL